MINVLCTCTGVDTDISLGEGGGAKVINETKWTTILCRKTV